MSMDQRVLLSLAQKAYVATDHRWKEHRREMAAAQKARRMTSMENEVAMIMAMTSVFGMT